MKKTHKLEPLEIVFYVLSAILMLWGITLCVLGIVEQFIPHENPFYSGCLTFVSLFGLHFLYWGLIILSIGAVQAIIVLCIFAHNKDRDFEKAQRRAARLNKTNVTSTNTIDAVVENK